MRGNLQTFTDLHGGVNVADSEFELQLNQARDARDVIGASRGSIRTRNGCSFFAAAAPGLESLFYAPDALFGAGGGTVLELYPTPTVLGIGFTSNVWSFASGPYPPDLTGTPTYLVNGVDTPQIYLGGPLADWVALSGTVPNGTLIAYLNNQVFIAGVLTTDARSTLYASDLDNPFVWDPATPGTSAYELPINSHDHDKITGLGTLGEYLLVFKQTSIYVITDTITGANRRLQTRVGSVAPRSIVEVPGGAMFLGSDSRVWRTDGTSLSPVSRPVDPILADIDLTTVKNTAAAAYHDDHYYLSIATATLGRITLDYDFTLQSWWLHTFAPLQWASYPNVDLNVERNLLYGQPYLGEDVCEAFVDEDALEDNGEPFTAYWKGPHLVFDQVDLRKRVRQIRLTGTGAATFKLAKDYGSAVTAKTATFPSTGTVGRVMIPTPGVAKAWSLELESADPFELDAQTWALTGRTD